MSQNNTATFKEKLAQLEELLAWFESDEVTLELAVEKYEQALNLSKELEHELKEAKNKIEVINQKLNT